MLEHLSSASQNPRHKPHNSSTCVPGVIHMTVQGFGMGMGEHELATLFQPFSRLRSKSRRKALALAYGSCGSLWRAKGAV